MKKRFAQTDSAVFESQVPNSHHNGSFQSYMTNKIAKLSVQNNQNSSDQVSHIFHGCSVYVNGATNPPSSEIRRLVTIHGGMYCGYLTGSVTHIVCDHFTDAQLKQQANKKRNRETGQTNVRYVNAEWILQCIVKMKRLPEVHFLPVNHWSRTAKQNTIASLFKATTTTKHNTEISTSSSITHSENKAPSAPPIILIDMITPSPPPPLPSLNTRSSLEEPIEVCDLENEVALLKADDSSTRLANLQVIVNLIHSNPGSGRAVNSQIMKMIESLIEEDNLPNLQDNCEQVYWYGHWLIQQELFEQVAFLLSRLNAIKHRVNKQQQRIIIDETVSKLHRIGYLVHSIVL